MRYSYTSLVALIVVALSTVRCSSDDSNPAGPSAGGGSTTITAEQIAGGWTLSSIQPAGEAEQIVPAGASYTMTIADGRLSTRADCNVCNGIVVAAGETVTIGPLLACTLAACPTMAFENRYTGILAGDSTARIDGDSLVLTSPRGVLRFHR